MAVVYGDTRKLTALRGRVMVRLQQEAQADGTAVEEDEVEGDAKTLGVMAAKRKATR